LASDADGFRPVPGKLKLGLQRAAHLLSWLVLAGSAIGADWPAYMRDAQRSGITTEQLGTNLAPAWIYPRVLKPSVAWADEAKKDASVDIPSQRPFKIRTVFDRANHVAVAGNLLFFGSATEHTIHCLNVVTGEPKWSFFTDGPVRMAPTWDSGKIYAGSDDGAAYCLDAITGALVWKYTPAGTNNYLVPNNGHPVSPFAIRSSVLVDQGVAYFAAGIFPSEGVYLCAVDALTGLRTTASHWQTLHVNQGSMQGYILLSPTRVYMPGGRSNPFYFNRSNGALLGQYNDREASGTFALLAGNSLFFGRAGRTIGHITEGGQAGDNLATYTDGNAMVVTATRSYLLSDTALAALDRATRAQIWSKAAAYPHALILAGTTLYAGGDNQVAAFDSANGNKLWSAPVQGRALGLAVAGGKLFVSTDLGFLHAFVQDQTRQQSAVLTF